MAVVGTIFKSVDKLQKMLPKMRQKQGLQQQEKTLRKLLEKASKTEFGKFYSFSKILRSEQPVPAFRNHVPVHDFNKIYREWWHRSVLDIENVCWPGKIKHFALSSGTSEASSKRIPVSRDMIHAIRRVGFRQYRTFGAFDLPGQFFEKGVLMLNGSTDLIKVGKHYEGDLSGIMATKLPAWLYRFYKPGKKVSKIKDWNTKLDLITEKAHQWDVGVIVGVPAWTQILIEKILDYYHLENIHELWPNFRVFIHGGVAFEPYQKGFEKLFGEKVHYLETYLASEGFLAYQSGGKEAMELVLDNGIFYEFIPFNDQNFDANGQVIEHPETYLINEVEEGKEYAVLISTCSGAWRYLIGDVVKFTDKAKSRVIITGRTKHFLSLCGEHLSVDNMNKAMQLVADDLNITIKEFTVTGIPCEGLFAHKWFIGTDDAVDQPLFKAYLDQKLKELNDDYAVERKAALKEIFVEVLPSSVFYKWLKSKGKEGGQSKFPRVLKGPLANDWMQFSEKEKA